MKVPKTPHLRATTLDGGRSKGQYVGMTEFKTPSADVDPAITEAVRNISNRFGAQGLCDLIALAHEELAGAESALQELAESQ